MNNKPIQNVVAALIVKDELLFAAMRSEEDVRLGKWEFPGGKIEVGESEEDALRRELKEELEISIKDIRYYDIVVFEYPPFILNMKVFKCRATSDFKVNVHKKAGFYPLEVIKTLPFLPADEGLVKKILDDKDFFNF